VSGFLTAEDFDEAVGEAFDELPSWVLELLGDVVVRVEPRPRQDLRRPARWRLLLYREPILQRACTAEELRRLVRVELLRTVLAHLEIEAPQHAAPLAAMYN
jgi:predicted Zn-dependent protease with MMP-like domain